MSNTQFYNISQIQAKAAEINDAHKLLKQNIAEMENIIKDMNSVWQDAAQTKFAQQFESMRPDLTAFCDNIAKLSERASAHAKAVQAQSEVL